MDKYKMRYGQLFDKITEIIKELKKVQNAVDMWYAEEGDNKTVLSGEEEE